MLCNGVVAASKRRSWPQIWRGAILLYCHAMARSRGAKKGFEDVWSLTSKSSRWQSLGYRKGPRLVLLHFRREEHCH
jgi:hypothetical protein